MATKAGVARLKDVKQGRTLYAVDYHTKATEPVFITKGHNGYTFEGRRAVIRGVGITKNLTVLDTRTYPLSNYNLDPAHSRFIGDLSPMSLLFVTRKAAQRWVDRHNLLIKCGRKEKMGFVHDNDVFFSYPGHMHAVNLSADVTKRELEMFKGIPEDLLERYRKYGPKIPNGTNYKLEDSLQSELPAAGQYGAGTENMREGLRRFRNSLPVRAVGESEISPSAQMMLQSSINMDAEICAQREPENRDSVATTILNGRPFGLHGDQVYKPFDLAVLASAVPGDGTPVVSEAMVREMYEEAVANGVTLSFDEWFVRGPSLNHPSLKDVKIKVMPIQQPPSDKASD